MTKYTLLSDRGLSRRRLALLMALLAVLLTLSTVSVFVYLRVLRATTLTPVVPSARDTRAYRALELKNSLRVTLVQDSSSTEASVSVAVGVGHLGDVAGGFPDGTAHFLEHLLFMGTTKYPSMNHADEVVSKAGGYITAYTDYEVTNYFFMVTNNLRGAMDVLAQFFVGPLITEDAVQREIGAVESEYQIGTTKDLWSIHQLGRELCNPDSAFHGFSTGSISTLNRTDIQEKLWEFFDNYYSANLITVAIVGNETLDTLQEWAEEIFTAIPNKDKTKPEFNVLPFPAGDKRYINRRVYYHPKSDTDRLKLLFPINIPDYPNLNYVTYFLGHEGKGSLYQYLSTRGFITTLMASINVEAKNFILIDINFDLTDKGLRDPNVIVEALFKYIKRIKDAGVNENRWQENKDIDNISFLYKEKESAADYASHISSRMARVDDPRDYLNPPSRRHFNRTLEELIMSFITPDNMNMYISSLKFSTENRNAYGPALEQVEQWYKTPYTNDQIKDADIKNWEEIGTEEELHLPDANEFIPDDFRILTYEGSELPVRVNNSLDMTIWWFQDNQFEQPKVFFSCSIMPKPTTPTMKKQLLSDMLYRMFMQETAAVLYPAITVEYEISLSFDDVWHLSVGGFSHSDKVKHVINTGMGSLFDMSFDIDESFFNATIREPLRKHFLNVQTASPAALSMGGTEMLQDKYFVEFSKALDMIDSLTQEEVMELRDTFLEDISMDCSAIGNVDQSQAVEYAEIVKTKLVTGGSATITKEDRLGDFDFPALKLPAEKTLVIRQKVLNTEEPNSAVVTAFQIGPIKSNGELFEDRKPYTRYVLTRLLGLMMREPCFNYLRTKQQLGYVASCFDDDYKDIANFYILVQGSRAGYGAQVIAAEHDKLVELQFEVFQELNSTAEGKATWEDLKLAIQQQIEQKPISLSEYSAELNGQIFSSTRDFSRKKKMVEALEEVTADDFLTFYQTYLMGSQMRKISSQIYGKDDVVPTEELPEGSILVSPDIAAYRDANLRTGFGDDE